MSIPFDNFIPPDTFRLVSLPIALPESFPSVEEVVVLLEAAAKVTSWLPPILISD
jgi:hypothetical protein